MKCKGIVQNQTGLRTLLSGTIIKVAMTKKSYRLQILKYLLFGPLRKRLLAPELCMLTESRRNICHYISIFLKGEIHSSQEKHRQMIKFNTHW